MGIRFNGQAFFALVLLVITTVYASQIFKLGVPFRKGIEPGASFLPIVLSAIMYIGALRILITELRRPGPQVAARARSEHIPAVGITGPLIVIALTILFTAGLHIFGYFVAAGLYTFGVAFYFNYEDQGRPLKALLFAMITATVITGFGWLFFVRLFDLSLLGWSL